MCRLHDDRGAFAPKSSNGGKFNVTVTDAGDPVKGAVVHYNGSKKTTDQHGRATFHVPAGTAKG